MKRAATRVDLNFVLLDKLLHSRATHVFQLRDEELVEALACVFSGSVECLEFGFCAHRVSRVVACAGAGR